MSDRPSIYGNWTDEALISAATLDRGDYLPGALTAIEAEIESRNIDREERDRVERRLRDGSALRARKLTGVRGWLLVFTAVVVVNSLAAILGGVAGARSMVASPALGLTSLPFLAFGLYGAYVSSRLIRRKSDAPKHAMHWLLSGFALTLLYAAVFYAAGGGLDILPFYGAVTLIWYTYLDKSERVAATYGKQEEIIVPDRLEEAETPAPAEACTEPADPEHPAETVARANGRGGHRWLPLGLAMVGALLFPVLTSDPQWLEATLQRGWWKQVIILGASASLGAVIGLVVGGACSFVIGRRRGRPDLPTRRVMWGYALFGTLFSLAPSHHLIDLVQNLILIRHYLGKPAFAYDMAVDAVLLILSLVVGARFLTSTRPPSKPLVSYFAVALSGHLGRPLFVGRFIASPQVRDVVSQDTWVFLPVPFLTGALVWGGLGLVALVYLHRLSAGGGRASSPSGPADGPESGSVI